MGSFIFFASAAAGFGGPFGARCGAATSASTVRLPPAASMRISSALKAHAGFHGGGHGVVADVVWKGDGTGRDGRSNEYAHDARTHGTVCDHYDRLIRQATHLFTACTSQARTHIARTHRGGTGRTGTRRMLHARHHLQSLDSSGKPHTCPPRAHRTSHIAHRTSHIAHRTLHITHCTHAPGWHWSHVHFWADEQK